MSYTVKFSGGRSDETHETLEAAKASLENTWEEAFFYECDGEENRTLVWANEEDSENDDGAKAVASIYAGRDL